MEITSGGLFGIEYERRRAREMAQQQAPYDPNAAVGLGPNLIDLGYPKLKGMGEYDGAESLPEAGNTTLSKLRYEIERFCGNVLN